MEFFKTIVLMPGDVCHNKIIYVFILTQFHEGG
jgi:hypothetical protein